MGTKIHEIKIVNLYSWNTTGLKMADRQLSDPMSMLRSITGKAKWNQSLIIISV